MEAAAPALAVGLAVAAAAWAWLFLPPPPGFWARAAAAGAAIGAYGALAQRHRLGLLLRPTAPDVALGVPAAAALYGVFWVGDRVLRRVLPAVAAQVDDLYAAPGAGRGRVVVSLVVCVVGLAEELFWRGFVQARAGWVLALAGYAAVHLWERKAALVLAAITGGAFWAALFAWRGTLVAPIVSHVLWDLAAVVWFPFAGRSGRERPTRR